jgi:hypothetical protein
VEPLGVQAHSWLIIESTGLGLPLGARQLQSKSAGRVAGGTIFCIEPFIGSG